MYPQPPRYHGPAPMPPMPGMMFPGMHRHGAPGAGFCHGCGHPKSKCVCGCCECRKEAKELLVKSDIQRGDFGKQPGFAAVSKMQTVAPLVMNLAQGDDAQQYKEGSTPQSGLNINTNANAAAAALQVGLGTAFIGGGCCVHLSIEYAPTTPASASLVGVLVQDSDGTLLAWIRSEKAGTGYQIKECIVTTKPGANLVVVTVNMTARVRWCEVFSCC